MTYILNVNSNIVIGYCGTINGAINVAPVYDESVKLWYRCDGDRYNIIMFKQ